MSHSPRRHTHEAIAAYLRSIIRRANPGDRLPSQSELKRRFEGVSHITISRAYQSLVKQGLVVAEPFVGYFVRLKPKLRWRRTLSVDPTVTGALPELENNGVPVDTWALDAARAGHSHRQEISVEVVTAAEQIDDDSTLGDLLDLPPDAPVVARRRIRYVGPKEGPADVPESLAVSYYPMSLVEGTPLVMPGSVNTARVLAERGLTAAHSVDTLWPRIATAQEAEILRLPEVTPVIHSVRVTSAPDGTKWLVQSIVSPSPLIYELPAPGKASQ